MKAAVLTRQDLKWLAAPKDWPCLTVYGEIRREGYQPEAVLKRWTDTCDQLEHKLQSVSVSSRLITTLLKPLRQLDQLGLKALYRDFQGLRINGLAYFISPEGSRVYVARDPFLPLGVVRPHFELRPLLAATSSYERFFLLSVSAKDVRLWQVNPMGLETVELPASVPHSLEGFLEQTEFSPKLAYHAVGSGAPGATVGKWYGTVARDKEDKIKEDFVLAVTRPLGPLLLKEHLPVVLVATKDLAVKIRKHLSVPLLMDEDIPISPEHLTHSELEERGRNEIRTYDDRIAAEELSRLKEHFGTTRTASTCDDIWEAARAGKIDVLLASETGVVPLEDERGELVSAVIQEVLHHQGRVLVTRDPFLQPSCPMGAILRW